MNNELIVNVGTEKHKVFLQNGFYPSDHPTENLHKHNFAEIHMISGGSAEFIIGERHCSIKSGDIFLIPRGVFHCCVNNSDNALHSAFQIEHKSEKLSILNMGSEIILSFFEEIKKSKISGDYTRVSAYITLFCSYFPTETKLDVSPVTDYGFLINEFFSLNYNKEVHLCDLADYLYLSERQCERLVIMHTGNTFREALSAMRMHMAKNLLKTTEMPLKKISEYVGYKSYTGFWKAMKKYNS